jgi:hypothetical protein
MPARTYTATEVDAAVARLGDAEHFAHASEIVSHAAPSLAGVLDRALVEGGWYGAAHETLVRRASGESDPAERVAAVHALVDEQTRIGMLVGVAVGFELANELARTDAPVEHTDMPERTDATLAHTDPTPTEET